MFGETNRILERLGRIEALLESILNRQKVLEEQGVQLMTDFSELTTEEAAVAAGIAQLNTDIANAISAISTAVAQIAANAGDPAAVSALSAKLQSDVSGLQSAHATLTAALAPTVSTANTAGANTADANSAPVANTVTA